MQVWTCNSPCSLTAGTSKVQYMGCNDIGGANAHAINNTMQTDKASLNIVFETRCNNLANNNEYPSNLVLLCDHGKHRSVGVAQLTNMAMSMASHGRAIKDLSPLMQKGWPNNKQCSYVHCPECLEDNEANQKCYINALERFKQ